MAQLNVSIPEGLKNHVDGVVANGNYASPSDYIRDLIRQDQDEAERLARLRSAIDRGVNSPDGTKTMKQIYDENRSRRDAA